MVSGNKAVFEGEFLSPTRVNQIATDQLENYKRAEQEQRDHGGVHLSTEVPRWQKPTAVMIKINWDTAIDKSGDKMGVGVVAGEHIGNVVGALCCTRPSISDPATAEAVGAWKAVSFGRQLGLDHVVFQGDSLEVLNAMKNANCSWARYGMMINAAKEELLSIPGIGDGSLARNFPILHSGCAYC